MNEGEAWGACDRAAGGSRSIGDRGRRRVRAARASQRPVRPRPGRRGLAGSGAGRPSRRAAVRRHPAGAVRPRLAAAAGRGRTRSRRVGEGWPVVQRRVGRPPGHRGRVQGLPLRRQPRPRVRLLRHHADVPAQRAQPGRRVAGGRRARHVGPGASAPDRHADDHPDALAARVAEPQPQARAAGRGQWQPRDGARVRIHLRRAFGLPPPRAAVVRALGTLRPRERLFARWEDVLRDEHGAAGDHGDRRHQPEDAARGLAGQRLLPRHDPQRRWQPRLHRGPEQPRPAHPRHEPDPSPQAQPAGAGDQPAHLELGVHPAECDPVHGARPPLRARVRRVRPVDAEPERRQGHGRRGPDHRHRGRNEAVHRVQPAPRR